MVRSILGRVVFYATTVVFLSSSAYGQVGPPSQKANVLPASANQLDVLRQSIMTLFAPDTWDKVGGDGSIVALNDWNLLVVSQGEEVHVQIHEYLSAIRQIVAMRQGDEGVGQVPVIQIGELRNIQNNRRIEEELTRPTRLDFDGFPLTDVAKALAESHSINVQISRRALDEVGIAADIPVRAHLENIPLRSALNLVLGELDLAYVVKEGVLVVTTSEDAQIRQSTKVYDVSGLLTE